VSDRPRTAVEGAAGLLGRGVRVPARHGHATRPEEIDQIEAATSVPHTEPAGPPGHDDTSLVGARGTAPRVAGATGVLLLVALMGMFGVVSADPAQAAPPNAPGITITGVEAGGLMELTATLTNPNGHPLPDAEVAFLFTTKEFGTPGRLVPLGSVKTDKTGIARLTLGGDVDHLYRPTANGPQEFVATHAVAGAQPVSSSTTVNVTIGRSAYHPAPAKPLAGVGHVLVPALFAIVAAIWLTLAIQVWRVRRVCRGSQPRLAS